MTLDKIGGYQLVKPLRSGGMGDVYFAVSPTADRVAIKVIKRHLIEAPTVRDRFATEVESPQADLYALGCVLHEVLIGAPPYQADTALDLVRSHLQAPVPLVSEHRHDVPDGVVRLVKQLLAKDPRHRPGSAAEVYDLLIPWVIGDVGLMRQPSHSERGGEVATRPCRTGFLSARRQGNRDWSRRTACRLPSVVTGRRSPRNRHRR